MKDSNDTIGNRTRDLLTCSAVPQPTAPPRSPYIYINMVIIAQPLNMQSMTNTLMNINVAMALPPKQRSYFALQELGSVTNTTHDGYTNKSQL